MSPQDSSLAEVVVFIIKRLENMDQGTNVGVGVTLHSGSGVGLECSGVRVKWCWSEVGLE